MKSFKDHLLDEDLRKWFGKGKEGDWVRVGTDGEIKGECAREKGEGKPKCMPRSRAHGMDKDDRAKAARRKRRKDPVADRPGKGGKPVMVATEETISEKNVPTKPALWAKYKAQAKAKFDVYPSAYANGWASKMYKKAGGGWKSVSEGVEAGVAEACWSGYKKKGMKKKGDRIVPNCVPEEKNGEELGNKLLQAVKEMKEGKEHSWKSEGHYTKDGKEWTGPQHAHDGQVMTGEKHTADSQNLYHYKELSPEVRKKVAKTIEEKLDATKNSIGDYVKDFSKSDAPQFKGKSSSKRRQMAIAAYLGSKRRDGERKLGEEIKYNSDMGAMDWGTPAGTEYMKDVTPGEKKKKKVKEETEAGETKAEYRKDNAEEAPELGDYALTKQDIKELELEADAITWEQAVELGMYDPNELEDDLNSADPHDEVNITEVLSVQGRLKRKFAARKNKQKLKVARNIALRRGSSPDRLKKRATRGARGMVYKRLLKGRDRSSLPPAEKGRLEKLIKMYTPLVSRLAVRMLPGMRKMEINRMKNRKGGAAQKSKKYKAAAPVRKTSQKAKKFKVKR